MTFDREQKGIMGWSALALLVTGATLSAGYFWLPSEFLGLNEAMTAGGRLAFALKVSLPVFLWLAWCLRMVSSGRFRVPADRRGAAYGEPTPDLAVRIAILQNTLEQTVLLIGALLILAAVLRGPELVLIPLSVTLYLVGRVAFDLNYSKGAVARSFGMALTAGPIICGFLIAITVIFGR